MAADHPDLATTYLADIRRAFRNYKALGDSALKSIPDTANSS